MRKLFNSQAIITQPFGVNAEYYKQFGLLAHEGLDCVPTGTDWSVLCLEDGVVVFDDDVAGDPRTDAYGINVTVYHKRINKKTRYCHLEKNIVSLGQQLVKGERLGTMGSTGNVDGAHLHLNLYETDSNGNILNPKNGYNGGIDPLPFLQEDVIIPPMDSDKQKAIANLDQYRKERRQGAEGSYEGYVNAIIGSDRDAPGLKTDLQSAQGEIERFKGQIKALNTTIETQDEAIGSLKNQLKTTQDALKVYKNPVALFFIKLADLAES